jgi:tetratricopeptide (TPR) repeat protein
MADEAKFSDLSESEKSDEVAALKAELKEEQAAPAAISNGSDQPKSGGSLADAQQQRYLERALGRSTQTNMSKFTSNRLKAMVPPGEGGDAATEVHKDEPSKEAFEKVRSAETEVVLTKSPSFFGIAALICSIGVAGYLFVFMKHKGDALKNQPGQAASNASGNNGAKANSDPALGAFYLNRAELSIHAGAYRKALADLKAAYLKDPANKAVYLEKIAEVLTIVKDNKGVVVFSEELLGLQPTNVTALLQHAQASYLIGNKISARDDLFKAIQLAPANAQAYLARGAYYKAEKEYSSAEADFKHALELDPKIPDAKEKLAAVQASQKEVNARTSAKSRIAKVVSDSERPVFTQAELQQLNSSDLNTLRQAGLQAMTRKRYDFAVAALKRCVIINPNDPQSRKLLAYALINAGDASAAFDQFNAWDSIVGLGLEEQLAFGRALTKAGDTQTTTAFFNFLVDGNANNAQALLRVAQMADKAGCPEPVDKAVNLGLKLSAGTLRYQFLVLMRRLQTHQIEEDAAGASASASSAPGIVAPSRAPAAHINN